MRKKISSEAEVVAGSTSHKAALCSEGGGRVVACCADCLHSLVCSDLSVPALPQVVKRCTKLASCLCKRYAVEVADQTWPGSQLGWSGKGLQVTEEGADMRLSLTLTHAAAVTEG